MTINLIICTTKDYLVGDLMPKSKNGMSWYSREELMYFKECTIGHTLIFGLNTSKFIPIELMKKNRNIEVMSPENDWYKIVEKYKNTSEEIFICGGYSVYKWFIDEAIKHKFKYPFNISRLFVSYLKDHVEIYKANKPLYLPLNDFIKYFKYHEINEHEDFNGYVYYR